MMRKILVPLTVLLCSYSLVKTTVAETNTTDTPVNIVVFLVDDMGVMDTSVPFITDSAGKAVKHELNQWYHTPNMESLAQQGTRFSQFYAQSVCSPTRVSLLTGQNATRHHTTTWINPSQNNRGEFGPASWNWSGLNKNSITFPRLLNQAGYKTIHIGKGHFGALGTEGSDPLNLGFDVNIAGGPWGRPKSYYGRDYYGNHPKYQNNNQPLTHNIQGLAQYYENDEFLTEALTQEAKQQIRAAVSEDKPFLLYVSHYAVHAPFHHDPRFIDRYKDRGKPENAQAYASLVEGVDKSLGDIIDQLKELNVAENTLVLFIGDNGGDAPLGHHDAIASAAPLKGKKGTGWEGGMRAPLLISWAQSNLKNTNQNRFPIASNQINTQIATILDIYPTVLNIAGVENHVLHTVDGENLNEQLAGKFSSDRKNHFLMHFPHKHRHSYFTSFRQDDWKLIYQYNPENNNKVKRYQLFNLADDVAEEKDLATLEPEILLQMMGQMISELESQNAQYPVDSQGNALRPLLPGSNTQS